jgi:hypothetical protein
VDFPEPGLVNSTINCATASAVAGTITCYGGTTTVTVSATGGTAPYTGTGTFTVGAGTYEYTVTDANGCMSTVSITVEEADESTNATWYLDEDSDGYYTATTTSCLSPGAGYTRTVIAEGDCAPTDGTKWRTAMLYIDSDGDGYDAGQQEVCYGAAIPAGFKETTLGTDCNDNNSTITTGTVFYRDSDGDGYGDAKVSVVACSAPAGYTINSTDCNDNDRSIYPGAPELCDGKDNNCDGRVDEGALTTYYRDSDGDGWGDNNTTIQSCSLKNGYVAKGGDCNDRNSKVNPGVSEICGNGIDDNCNGTVDEGCALPSITINDIIVFETQGTARLTVTLSNASTSSVKVNYQTMDGSAGSKDYRAVRGTLSIPAGSREGTISISILADKLNEPDEYFDVQLSGAIGAVIMKSSGRVTIRNGAPMTTTTHVNDKRATMMEIREDASAEPLMVTASPNPSSHSFTLMVKSRLNKPVTVSIVDAVGRILEVRSNLPVDGLIKLGASYRPGVYFVEVRQGEHKKQLQLIKASE